MPIPANLTPLLAAMETEADGDGRAIQHTHANKDATHGFPPLEDLSRTLRKHLRRAGVKREELFTPRPTSKQLTFYDLRATGITWEVFAKTAVGINVGETFPAVAGEHSRPTGRGSFVPVSSQ